jgi:hypothetical protein
MNLMLYVQTWTSFHEWFTSPNNGLDNILPVLVFAVAYFLIVLLVRWHILARFLGNRLRAEITMVSTALKVDGWKEDEWSGSHDKVNSKTAHEVQPDAVQAAHTGNDERQTIINAAGELLRKAWPIADEWHFWDFLFWSRGGEVAGLSYVRQAERLHWMLCSDDEVRQHLLAMTQEMQRLKRPGEAELAREVEKVLRDHKADAGKLRVGLQELLRAHHEGEAAYLIDLIGQHNKAMWMISVALLLVTALAWAVSSLSPKLFLAGAIGGFLSRMMRILKEGHSKNAAAYSESWVTLFISPLVGALAGWTGVLLIVVSNLGMQTGGGPPTFPSEGIPHYYALGLAILLGFSERYFDSLVSRAGERPAQKKEQTTGDSA